MTQYSDVLFNESPEQLLRLGAYGGRASGRNHRARRRLVSPPLATARPCEKLPPKPSTRWTNSFLGCRARKSKCLGNRNEASERAGALPGSTERPYRSERKVRARVVALCDLRSRPFAPLCTHRKLPRDQIPESIADVGPMGV
jgi:hypothetical protein